MAEPQIAAGIPEDIRADVEIAANREGLRVAEWIHSGTGCCHTERRLTKVDRVDSLLYIIINHQPRPASSGRRYG
ncbi:MAG: hypothetical protein ACK4Z3_01505, partial [Rhizobium rosettiformans]